MSEPGALPPEWLLPEGVDAPLWTYAHTARLAESEDSYFAGHALQAADGAMLRARFRTPGRLIDLGCGAGRLSLLFAGEGFKVVAVDLAPRMLETVALKARSAGVEVGLLRANLCRLECLRDHSFDYAISMFSTLGMLRGSNARLDALRHARRILKPQGRLAIHAHNLWLNLRDPEARRWLVQRAWKIAGNAADSGDRIMDYRGVARMTVHLYRWPELAGEVRSAGFAIEEVVPLDLVTAQPIRMPRFLPNLRAGGWIVFARAN